MKRILWVIGIVAFSANLPAPLFPIYQMKYNLNNLAITALFAIYAVCMLISLLLTGSLAEKKGTKWVVTAGIILALISSVIFIGTTSSWMLYLARAIQGIALGAFMGTSNALLLHHTPQQYIKRSLAYSSMATLFGFGLGPAISGVIIQYSSFIPEALPYVVLLVLLLLALGLLFTVPPTNEKKNKQTPIRFRLGIPSTSQTLFIMFICPAVFVMLALNGVVISLIPTFVHTILHSNNLAWSGLLLFIFLSGGAIAQQISWPSLTNSRIQVGIVLLLIGAWLMIMAGYTASMILLFIGMIILSIGNGWTFQASMQLAGSLGKSSERPGIISTYYLAGYTGMAIPTIGVGLLSTIVGLLPALIIFGTIVTLIGISIVAVPKIFERKKTSLNEIL
ncbi:MFS transporter [Bacillus nitratireducens]|uniref:MFS transporter n=1 Tax=Bacillus nitratireducens TaxID=2026193 RepID=UPI001BA8C8F6|nr:MFS transporter [Bacillus nitratireducens]QUG82491.1 MFS transporter [Bacillus nitratireducens]